MSLAYEPPGTLVRLETECPWIPGARVALVLAQGWGRRPDGSEVRATWVLTRAGGRVRAVQMHADMLRRYVADDPIARAPRTYPREEAGRMAEGDKRERAGLAEARAVLQRVATRQAPGMQDAALGDDSTVESDLGAALNAELDAELGALGWTREELAAAIAREAQRRSFV